MGENKKRKRGFTIVELVIVIAVVGILAGILVPTFANLIDSSKLSKDLVTVTNVNKVYTVDKLEKNIKKYDTMHDALNEIYDNSFKLDNIQHTSANNTTIAWNSINDTFVLINTKNGTYYEGKEQIAITNKSDYFVVYDSVPNSQEYSIYLTNRNTIGEISHLEVGFDSGNNYSVSSLVYDRSGANSKRDVIFRTNAGTDTEFHGYVDPDTGEGDSIYHYGESKNSTVDCADGSYHEYGAISHVEVQKGHFVQENKSFVSYINASASSGDVSIDFLSGSTHGTAKNTNDTNGVSVHAESGAKSINADYDYLGGRLEVTYDQKPEYSNQVDRNENIDGNPFVLEGIGNKGVQERELPHFTEFCEQDGHSFIAKEGYSLKICERCGSYEETVLRPLNNEDELEETTYLHRHEDNANDNGGFVVINSSHEHIYSSPTWSWTSYTKAIARFVCSASDCENSVSFTIDGSDIERQMVTEENCTQDGIYDHVATVHFNDHEYQSTSPYQEIVEHLGHILEHHDGEDATCTEHGHTAYDVCTREGCDYTTYQTIEPKGHTPSAPVQENVVPATCTSEGSYDSVVYCSACNAELSRETIHTPMEEHNGDPCSVCGHTELNIKLPHTDKYTYKVGTVTPVPIGNFFDHLPATYTPVITTIRGNASATFSNGQFTFANDGVVRIQINSQTLELEVVNGAKNIISGSSAVSASSDDIVLLTDIDVNNSDHIPYSVSGTETSFFASVENGHILYGNGFEYIFRNDAGCYNMSSGNYIYLNSGTIDNVQFKFPTLSQAALYQSQLNNFGVAYQTFNNDGSVKRNYRLDTINGVHSEGNSVILNSYIYGARTPLNAVAGHLEIENTTLDGGSLANMLIEPSASVVLTDLTTIQKPYATKANPNKQVLGLGILCFGDSSSCPEITVNGELKQYNWLKQSDSQYIPTITGGFSISSIVSQLFSKTRFLHNFDNVNHINSGISFMEKEGNSIMSPASKITDNRTNKNSVVYDVEKIANCVYVYSYVGTNGTDNGLISDTHYIPNKTMVVAPTLSVSGYDSSKLSFEKSFSSDKWLYTLTAEKSSTFSFNQVSFAKFGESLTNFNVVDNENNAVDKNTALNLNNYSSREFTLSLEYEGTTFAYIFVIESKVSEVVINKPELTTNNYGSHIYLKDGSNWSIAVPALTGLIVTYYSSSQNKYVKLDLTSLTPSQNGIVNSTNKWTYGTNDYSLTITSSNFKSNDDGKPVVYNNILYFGPSSTSGFVSSGSWNSNGTTSRSVTLSYLFIANNDELTFSHTWNVDRQTNGTNYSTFTGSSSGGGSSGGGGGGCLLPNTLITMADNTKKMVKDVEAGDLLKVFNHETGSYDVSPVVFNDKEEAAWQTVVNLEFSNGEEVGVISEHGFFDMNLMQYVYIREDNYLDFVGHQFYADSGLITLDSVYITEEYTEVYSPVTAVTLNYFTNDILSMPGGIEGLFNIFEYDSTLQYNQEKMEADIAMYGLLDYSYYEDFSYINYNQVYYLHLHLNS